MRCPKCASENPGGKRFCGDCGAPLANLCPKCGADNPAGKRFCGDCGASLATVPSERPPIPASSEPAEIAEGERRHLTVLFCDLVNSTEIAAHLDPEEWRDIAADYQRAAAEAVTRLDGHVAKYLGDGLMVYFGWPRAHEDDGERAVRAGLAIVDAMTPLNDRLAAARRSIKLAVRVGIHTGSVVVDRGASGEPDVFGDVPNIAARLQSEAEANSVFITATLHRLVSGLFVVEDRGAHTLKGIAEPVELYRVLQPSLVRRRAHRTAGALTRFVGRDDEIRLLLNRWERAREGEGQLVLVVGEAGIGKSRLMEEFRERIKPDPHLWIECAGEQSFHSTPFHPVIQMLDQGLGWRGDESNEERIVQLERSLELFGLKLPEALPLIAEMLNLPLGERYAPPAMPPDQKRRRLLAALAGWVFAATRTQPMVIALEDLHWVDPSTLELMQMLVEQAATAPLMLLYTARPEFRPAWPMRGHHSQLTLNRLSERHMREMVAGVAARSALTKDLIDTVVRRTDGVPLFAEELTRLIVDGDARSAAREIPATLHDSLTARLDRLGPAREVAQLASVIGREFSYQLLNAVASVTEAELQSALARLADAELIYARGLAPEATYQFKHALIQDAAYEALLKTRRKELHRRVAQAIADKFPALADAQPEVLAHHWAEAGEGALAIDAWQRAAERAVERGAFAEAEVHLRQALATVGGEPETAERDSRELTLQLALGRVFVATRSWSAAETAAAFARAGSLAERTGGAESLQAFASIWQPTIARCELRAALALADRVFQIAHEVKNPRFLVSAHFGEALTRLFLGDPEACRKHLEQALELYREEDFRGLPDDHGVNSLAYRPHAEWLLGYPDRSVRHREDARRLARRLNKPFGQGYAEALVGMTDAFVGDFAGARFAGEEAQRLGTEMEFPTWRAFGKILGSWGRAQMGELDGAVEQIKEGLAELDATEFFLMRGLHACRLAEAQALAGMLDDALATVENALESFPDEIIYRPLMLRLRGEFRSRRNGRTDAQRGLAEQDFRDAIAQARKMNAKSFELRAATALARLLRDTNRREEARTTLAEIYNWFTEGFDTADLRDAKALLREL